MYCPVRLMLMRLSASVRCNTSQSHMLVASFLFVHTVMLRLYLVAEMMGRVAEVEWVFVCASCAFTCVVACCDDCVCV